MSGEMTCFVCRSSQCGFFDLQGGGIIRLSLGFLCTAKSFALTDFEKTVQHEKSEGSPPCMQGVENAEKGIRVCVTVLDLCLCVEATPPTASEWNYPFTDSGFSREENLVGGASPLQNSIHCSHLGFGG